MNKVGHLIASCVTSPIVITEFYGLNFDIKYVFASAFYCFGAVIPDLMEKLTINERYKIVISKHRGWSHSLVMWLCLMLLFYDNGNGSIVGLEEFGALYSLVALSLSCIGSGAVLHWVCDLPNKHRIPILLCPSVKLNLYKSGEWQVTTGLFIALLITILLV
ncbi:metal-dependent hydrolase [Vibrio barjaei]|uniref:metal-dependent hydrolase n=1 Tax=Vibrio barjaei TaxID=1676683 RepID=UPI0039909A59